MRTRFQSKLTKELTDLLFDASIVLAKIYYYSARRIIMPVEMGLRRIIISEIHEQQVIVLKELEGDRSFSIQIGIFGCFFGKRR